ncbi:CoA pyrophosphatase [Novosphingobium mangrovi (ex Hu et al. 2023)]|uniref:CoA pyrophosphatase n=1 Tax=Novosphingobium mangrovi (ex Hu et al. 2023) TaxID=2930094 RepID=A0ABT0AA46_9SPHN|nr:CoA pyrophosphatase [Novosphingobium mangrovi (ex Hu et al. 2023)]MCJ1960062.1 CoA pyrophosphatase [Novosphingobium mangrovi (ex Hu et al. 2023)]
MSALFEAVKRRFEAREGHAQPHRFTDPRTAQIENFIPAAVLIALTERERPGMLLLHRPSSMRAHPGQVAFPGGRIDPGEAPVEAALREANEELGIDPACVRVVGTGDLYRTGSGYEITPVLGIVPPDIEIRPNPAEVAKWFEAPVDFVLDPANQKARSLKWEGAQREYVEIMWEGHRIWGVTGAIITNLTHRLNWHD